MATSSVSNGGGGFTRQMSGATSTIAGVSGAVPTPNAGDQEKALLGNGTWGEVSGKDRLFLSNTVVAPAIALNPTVAEITTAKGTAIDTVIYYTGTNLSTDTPTFIYHVDNSGVVTLLNTPSTGQLLTYGRVRANATLPTLSYVTTGVGTALNFDSTLYSSGMTFSGTNAIIPSVSGRYKAEWFAMVGSTEVNGDGTFKIVQNGVSVGQVYVNMMQAAGVNQIAPFIDVDLVAGLPVTLNYQAAVADSIPFEVGSYFQLSQLPTSTAVVVDTVAEYGEALPINATFPAVANVANDLAGGSFTLPSAGTWEIHYDLTVALPGSGNYVSTFIVNSSNTVVSGSQARGWGLNAGANHATLSQTVFITTTGSATYKLQGNAQTVNGAAIIQATSSNGASDGASRLVYKKIAGQLSSTGQSVDYIQAGLSADTTSTYGSAGTRDIIFNTVSSGNIPLNTTTGVFSLAAGKTYEIESQVSFSGAIGHMTFSWVDAVTNVQLITTPNFQNQIFTVDSGFSYTSSPVNKIVYTPSVNQTIKLRVDSDLGSTVNTNIINAGRGTYAVIKQLGSSNVTTTNYVAEFGTLQIPTQTNSLASTVPFTVSGSAFTLPSSGVWEISYNVMTSAPATIVTYSIVDSAGVAVSSNGSSAGFFNTTAQTYEHLSKTFQLTTTGAKSLKMIVVAGNNQSVSINSATNDTIYNNPPGNSQISWKKISGFSASSGSTVDSVSVNLITTNQSIPGISTDVIFNTVAFGNIPYNTTTGVFGLTAGKTYELEATLKSRATTAGYIQYEWVDAVTNTPISGGTNGLDIHAPATLVEGSSPRAYLMYAPSTNQTVKVRITGLSGVAIFLDAQRCNANIKQLGSTSNTVGTLPAVDQTTAGYFDIGNMRMQWGTHNDGNVDTTTVTLPMPYANTSYAIVATSNTSAGSLSTETKTITSFDIDRASTTTTTQDYSWFAIGSKP